MNVRDFFTEEQMKLIHASILKAEQGSTGEIRLHAENDCDGDPVERATSLFHRLHMHKTKHSNAVLFYLAVNHKKFAIVGDKAIHEKVSDEFWNKVKEHVIAKFKQGNYTDGICEGIEMAGDVIKKHFPGNKTNQLTDEVSFGH